MISKSDFDLAVARPSVITRAAKRVLDVVASASGIILLAPAFAVIAVLIKLDSPGPVFFRQVRIGRNGKPFRIFKFRSMSMDASTLGPALTVGGDPRITRIGAFLRRTKLDELPQLINVVLGEMSLVGPRPEVPQYMAMYNEGQRAVLHALKPGMTDYASVIFRDENALLQDAEDPVETYRQDIMPVKFRYYARYARDVSVATDIRIILATVYAIAFGVTPLWLTRDVASSGESKAIRTHEQI